jgi:gluconate 5-dehydrogenase
MKTIAYNTSKGAVINFTRALAGEWGRTASPSTPSARASSDQDGGGADRDPGRGEMRSHAPLRRLGDDEDLKGMTCCMPARRASTSPASGWRWMAA